MDLEKHIIQSCEHLKELLTVETDILKHHIPSLDDNNAVIEFNDKYGWLVREMYCKYQCPDGKICKLAKDYFV